MSDRTLYGRLTIATGIAFLICLAFFFSCEQTSEQPQKAEAETASEMTTNVEALKKKQEQKTEAILTIIEILGDIGESRADADFD
jgi:predicted lipid-binding transport protein (Tim44 family)